MNQILQSLMFVFLLIFISCKGNVNPPVKSSELESEIGGLPLDRLNLPDGFKIDIYADNVTNARSMSLAGDGTLYVGTRSHGSVYALKDTDGDFKVDKKYVLWKDGLMPNGVAYRDGDLYLAEVNRILKFNDIANQLDNPQEPEIIYDQYPTERHHGWKYIAFGPDGRLYVPVGAPCNICKSDEIYASITSINPDGTDLRIEQHGVRNTVGFTWHPETNELWFTDNGRDMLGDDLPACELNYAPKRGLHFGYPYCHQGDLPDPDFGNERPCSDFVAPAANLGAHTAPLGVEFMKSKAFPDAYKNKIFMAEHGSWNRSKKIGYRISMVEESNGTASDYRPFIDGWLDEDLDEAWGRPVDMEWMPDGSLLISDDFADVIYRVSYTKKNE